MPPPPLHLLERQEPTMYGGPYGIVGLIVVVILLIILLRLLGVV